jgi:hypothetical protein
MIQLEHEERYIYGVNARNRRSVLHAKPACLAARAILYGYVHQ